MLRSVSGFVLVLSLCAAATGNTIGGSSARAAMSVAGLVVGRPAGTLGISAEARLRPGINELVPFQMQGQSVRSHAAIPVNTIQTIPTRR